MSAGLKTQKTEARTDAGIKRQASVSCAACNKTTGKNTSKNTSKHKIVHRNVVVPAWQRLVLIVRISKWKIIIS